MFEKLRTAIETAPEKVAPTTTQLGSNVRHRAHVARGEGHSRIWETQTRTLERGVELLSKGKEMPVMKLVVPHAEKLVQSRLDQVTELPIDAFEGMNAKAAARSVRGLGWVPAAQDGFEVCSAPRCLRARAQPVSTRSRQRPQTD